MNKAALARVVGGLLVVLGSSPASADIYNTAEIEIAGVNQPGQLCSVDNLTGPAECAFSGTLSPDQGGATLASVARATTDAGRLSAVAYVDTTSSPFYPGTYEASSRANAMFVDNITMSPGNPFGWAIAWLTISTIGAPSNADSFGFTQLALMGLDRQVDVCSFDNAGSCMTHLWIWADGGFYLSANLTAQADVHVSGTAIADFWDTAFISSLFFTDIDGKPVDLAYTTASGLSYPMAPEPGSLALLGAGLAGLWIGARRRTEGDRHGHDRCWPAH